MNCDHCKVELERVIVQLHVRAKVARGEILRGWSFCSHDCTEAWWGEETEHNLVSIIEPSNAVMVERVIDGETVQLFHTGDALLIEDGEVELVVDRYISDAVTVEGATASFGKFARADHLNEWWKQPEEAETKLVSSTVKE